MKAAQIAEYGDASVIKIMEVPTPAPAGGQVLIKVTAGSINPFDAKVRAGMLKAFIPLRLPVTLGGDVAGTIEAVGEGVTEFKPGDHVYGQASAVAGNSGSFAEYAVTRAAEIAIAPKNLTLEQAASLPLVGVSALQGLTDHIKLQADQKIFITGGAGGIGAVAVQLATRVGAVVATTATGPGIDFAKSLGARTVFDYKTDTAPYGLSGYDAVFDTVGGPTFETLFKILKPQGIAVYMAAASAQDQAADLGITVIGEQTKVTTESLNQLTKLIEGGTIKPNIGKVYPLDEAANAFSVRDSGQVKGKIVIAMG